MKLFYSRNAERAPKGAKYRNPRFFQGVEDKASVVYLDGDYPEIEAAYVSNDVPVIRLDAASPAAVEAVNYPGADPVVIPADWRDLPWSQPADERGYSLRGVAALVSDSPIRSKEDAVTAIETYLAGDLDRPIPEAGSLSRRELNANLEALGLEIEPGEDPAETFQRIEGARASRDVSADLEGQDEPE